MKKHVFLPLLVLSLLVMVTIPAIAENVVADGYGSDRDSAIMDAKRNAISTVLGQYVDSQSLVANFQLVSDRILTSSSGYVTDFEVLSEANEYGTIHVQIRATVSTTSIRDDVNQIAVLSARRGNPRFIVVPDPNPTSDAFRPGDPAVGEAMRGITEFLATRSLQVIQTPVYQGNLVSGSASMLSDLALFGAGYGAEYAVYFSVISVQGTGRGRTFNRDNTATALVNISIVHTGTYRVVAQQEGRADGFDRDVPQFAIRTAAKNAAENAMNGAVDMVLADWSRFGSTAGAEYTLTIEQVEGDMLQEFMQDLPNTTAVSQVNSRAFTDGVAHLSVRIDGSTGTLAEAVRQLLQQKDWSWAMVSADGNSLKYRVTQILDEE